MKTWMALLIRFGPTARKLAPSNLPEIRDRALKALSSKVEGNLLPGEVALETPGLPQLILHWLNDRQAAVPPSAIATAFRLLGALAHAGPAAVRLQEAGCVPFLQDFRPQAPPECLKDLDAALWALLTHQRPTRPSDSAEEDLEAKYIGEKTLRPSSESPELCEADQQLLLDMAVRLKFSEGPHRCAAFLELLELAAEVPPKMILAYAPLVEAICLGIRDQAAATKASEVLCLLLERLGELSVPAVAGYGPPQRPRNLGEEGTPQLCGISWRSCLQQDSRAPSRGMPLREVWHCWAWKARPPEPGTKPDELLVGALHTALAAVGLVEKDVVALLFDSGLMVEYPKVSAALEVVAEEVACRLFQAHSEPQSAVYARVVRDFAAAQGPAELRRAVAPLLVSWPQSSQGLLTLPGYLPQILGALAPAMWMPREGSVDASHGPVVRFPDKDQMELLEHVYDVLRLTPAEEGSPGFRELGELFGRRLMPALWALLGQPASPAKVREAHGLLAADASLNRATELILRCSAALATNSEAKKALGPWQDRGFVDWQPLVTALVTAVTPPPRLALHVAIRLGAAKTGNDEAFAEAEDEIESTSASECGAPPLVEVVKVVVRGTFLHVEEGSLRGRFRSLRRFKTDSVAAGVFDELDAYEPGKLSSQADEADVPAADAEVAVASMPADSTATRPPWRRGGTDGKTTVMLRNIPNNYSRDMVLELLDDHGCAGSYNFVYLPFDFNRDANLGYAFVNLETSDAVDALWKTFHGFSDWSLPTVKVCQVCWSGPHQGLQAHVERYRTALCLWGTTKHSCCSARPTFQAVGALGQAVVLRFAPPSNLSYQASWLRWSWATKILRRPSAEGDSSSIRHSEALRAALWLAADFCSAEASAYVTPWLTHADAVVAAAAWRSLRCLLFARSEDADAEIQTARSAAAARAARALRGWARRWEMEEDSFLLPVAEALELIRWFLEASKEADSAEAARQVLDSGLVELNGVVANCLAARQLHLGVRRTAVRLLQALLAADFAAVGPKLFKVGFWSLAVSAAAPVYECTVLQTEAEHGQILDAASLAAEVMILVRQGSQSDPQLLLWLSAATPLLDSWKRALRGLGLSLASSTGSSLHLRQRALRLADAHLACLCHVMGHVEQAPSDFSWTSTDGWGPLHEVLVTEEVAFLLLETLKAEMPIATVALSTWSLLRCRGLGQDRVCMMGQRRLDSSGACFHAEEALELLKSMQASVRTLIIHGLSGLLTLEDVAAAAAADKDLGTVAARRSIAVLSTLGTGRAQAPGASTAQCLCLANLASASPEAATSAAEGAPELAAQAARLAALGRHQQQVLWILRAFFAILASSQDALEGSLGALELSNTTVLSTMILGVRAAADRDETICLELFEQLLQLFARTEISEPVAAELLRAEILPWLMRFSLKRSCACAAFCRVMDILAFCSSVLAGKPLLLRFLGQLIEAVRGQCKIPASDLWRNRRLTSAMNFIASTALVAKGNAPDAGTRRPISTPAAAGLDLWFDLVEGSLPGGAPRSVRSAALRVLLAVASSDSPHAKAGIDAWPRLAQWLRGTRSAAECRRMTPREGILHRMAEEVGSDSTQPMLSAYPS
eukprot:s459_g5.t1